jgi:hypothetical protein
MSPLVNYHALNSEIFKKKFKKMKKSSKKVLTKRGISDIIQKLSARAGSEPILEN